MKANFEGTKGNWILDSDDMLTIRAINTNGRIFITKANTLEYYEKGYKFSIAKAMAKKDNLEVERLRKELFQFDAEQFANARLMSKAPEMLEIIEELCENLSFQLDRAGVCGEGDGKGRKADADSYGGTELLQRAKQLIRDAT